MVALSAGLLALAACASATEYVPGPDSLMLAVRETVVVDTGFLYLHGNPIEPPYVFVIAGDSLYAELYINDYIADSIDKRPPDLDSLSPRMRLDREISKRLHQMRREGNSTVMERTEVAADMYRQHPDIVDSVGITAPGQLWVVYKGSFSYPNPEVVIVESGRTQRPPTAYETVAAWMERIVRSLRRGQTVTCWSGMLGYYHSIPDSAFAAWLEERPPWLRRLYRNPRPLRKRRR